MSVRVVAAEVAERSSDAYSTDRYTSWPACAEVLLRLGYTEAETETILRSKITRWAADASEKPYGRSTSADLRRYAEANREWIDTRVPEWVQ